jgi:hypothetical protein
MRYLILLLSGLILCTSMEAQFRPPEVPADDPFFQMGYLDVRLFGADHTGTQISTQEIRNAVIAAQEYKLACYFPSGTYLIDDTINCVMPIFLNNAGTKVTDRRSPVHIVGDDNPRPVIRIAPGATGYGAGSMKPMFWIRASESSPTSEQSNIAFNMVLRNMIFDTNGHRGAVGVRFSGAQGSTVQDVKVIATGSFAGFYNCTGQGGGSFNIEVEGGDYAFYLGDDNARFINMTGLTCRNQLIEVIKIVKTHRPILINGFHFVKESGPILSGWPLVGGGIALLDGIIEYTGSSTHAFPVPANNLFIKDVYFKNCARIISNNNPSALDPHNWTKVQQYHYTGSGGSSLINGVTASNGTYAIDIVSENPPSPEVLTTKHTWDPATFVSVSMRNESHYVNVKDATKMTGPNGPAIGNGSANDTRAIQWAIDNFEKVFLPKGTYLIDTTLVLRSNTQMFGAGKTYSIIQPGKTWKTAVNRNMITTVADAEATTSLSFLMLETDPNIHKDMTRIHWLAGRNSVIRDIMIGAKWTNQTGSFLHHQLKISGPTGGGSFYCYTSENNLVKPITYHPDYRAVLIENTTEPIRFYSYNSERIFADAQFEIKNSSNVEIFYLKSEANANDGQAFPLAINNSEKVSVYCLSGNIRVRDNRGIIEASGSNKIMAVNVRSSQTQTSFFSVKELYNSQTFSLTSTTNLSIFSRNAQTTVSKTIGSDGADYSSFIAAIKAEAPPLSTNDILILNVAEGVLMETPGQLINTNDVGKALKITIQGAGADKTFIQGPYSESNFPPADWTGAGRVCQWNDNAMGGSEIIFKNLTFKYWGGNANTTGGNGAVFNCNTAPTEGTVSLLFENVVFDSNVGRSLIATYNSGYTFDFDNCLFINNALIRSTQGSPVNGLIHKGNTSTETGPGDLNVTNSTFMNNTFDPATDGITGALINILPVSGSSVLSKLIIENNQAVNNKVAETATKESVQAMFGVTSFGTINLSLKNNILIGNQRAESKDVDIYISGYNRLNLTADNNIVNEAIDGTEGNPRLTVSGFKIDPTYTYTDSRINFEMDGNLPKLFMDENKIGYLVYTGDGSEPSYICSSAGVNFKVYSKELLIIIDGINAGQSVELYSLKGSLIKRVKASGNIARIYAPTKGIYIVRVEKKASKVVVY